MCKEERKEFDKVIKTQDPTRPKIGKDVHSLYFVRFKFDTVGVSIKHHSPLISTQDPRHRYQSKVVTRNVDWYRSGQSLSEDG